MREHMKKRLWRILPYFYIFIYLFFRRYFMVYFPVAWVTQEMFWSRALILFWEKTHPDPTVRAEISDAFMSTERHSVSLKLHLHEQHYKHLALNPITQIDMRLLVSLLRELRFKNTALMSSGARGRERQLSRWSCTNFVYSDMSSYLFGKVTCVN